MDRNDKRLLALSGGGYRAMLFHVGALWRLNELGELGRLTHISSVSGGSIAANRAMPYVRRLWQRRGVATFAETLPYPGAGLL